MIAVNAREFCKRLEADLAAGRNTQECRGMVKSVLRGLSLPESLKDAVLYLPGAKRQVRESAARVKKNAEFSSNSPNISRKNDYLSCFGKSGKVVEPRALIKADTPTPCVVVPAYCIAHWLKRVWEAGKPLGSALSLF